MSVKHFKQPPAPKHSRNPRRATVAVAAVAALALLGAAATFAYYTATSGITNMFTSAHVAPQVSEDFKPDVGTKERVCVTLLDDGKNIASYVRMSFSIYWQDGDGAQLWEEPLTSESGLPMGILPDYTIVMGDALKSDPQQDAWVEGADGFYYWCSPLEPGTTTDALIKKVTWDLGRQDGRKLVVDVSVQGIQADPHRAFNEAWGESSDLVPGVDGVLVRKGGN